jgi:hypothetical protein
MDTPMNAELESSWLTGFWGDRRAISSCGCLRFTSRGIMWVVSGLLVGCWGC